MRWRIGRAGWPQGGKGTWLTDPDSLVARVRVYAPSLEELIEGCGMLFSQLNRDVEGGWAAIGGAEGTGGSGKDPVEAVAALWLSINHSVE